MKTSVFTTILGSCLIGCASLQPTSEQLDTADYGTYPTNDEQIVVEWLTAKDYRSDNKGITYLPIRYSEILEPEKGWAMADARQGEQFLFGYNVVVKYLNVRINNPNDTMSREMTNTPLRQSTSESQEHRLTLFVRNDVVVEWQFERIK